MEQIWYDIGRCFHPIHSHSLPQSANDPKLQEQPVPVTAHFAAKMASRVAQIVQYAQRLLRRSPSSAGARAPTLNHVALAVPSLPAASAFYRDVLGLDVSAPQPLPAHGVTVSFVSAGGTNIELLEPLGDSSPIANFLNTRPAGGMHHLCVDVDDLSTAIAALGKHGIRTLAEPKIGSHGKLIVFLHPSDAFGSLIELQQR